MTKEKKLPVKGFNAGRCPTGQITVQGNEQRKKNRHFKK